MGETESASDGPGSDRNRQSPQLLCRKRNFMTIHKSSEYLASLVNELQSIHGESEWVEF